MLRSTILCLVACLCSTVGEARLLAQQSSPDLRETALLTLQNATAFYRDKVASHGGYVYYYSEDLQQRWGEGKAAADTIFVQPPGTPTVGLAYLKAYAATGDKLHLAAARDAAEALVAGRLASGGWTQTIDFANLPPEGKRREGNSSLDDGQTQAALQLLMRADQALNFKHAEIHAASLDGLSALLKAQFPNGAFPQVWRGPVQPQPILAAKFPDYDWKTEGRIKNYWDYYTLNDGLSGTVFETLLLAHQVYQDQKYQAAIQKLGDFLILAQLPEPQPAWAQQYNYEMVPIWARKFEPPAITGWESQDVLETLIKIAQYTGDKKYLEPVPRALAYLKTCLLPDGKIARYRELQTNKPLYMDTQYQLTYDDAAAPSHYGWKQSARFDKIEQAYQAAATGDNPIQSRSIKQLEKDVRRIVGDIDDQGRWVSTYAGEPLVGQPKFAAGFRYLSSGVFSRHLEMLSEYLAGR